MKIDFSSVGLRTLKEPSSEYRECVTEFQKKINSNNQVSLRDYCGDIEKQSVYRKALRLPRVYFVKPW